MSNTDNSTVAVNDTMSAAQRYKSNQGKSVNYQNEDGHTVISLDNDDFHRIDRKGDVAAFDWGVQYTKADIDAGKSFLVKRPDGQMAYVTKLVVKVDTREQGKYDEARVGKKHAAVLTFIRKASGLTTSKTPIDEADKLTIEQIQDWATGDKPYRSVKFDDLSAEHQNAVYAIIEKLQVKASKASPIKLRAAAYTLAIASSTKDRIILPEHNRQGYALAEREASLKDQIKEQKKGLTQLKALSPDGEETKRMAASIAEMENELTSLLKMLV